MVSTGTRHLIWNQQYDAMRLSRYYAELSSFRLSVQIVSQVVSVIASMGAILALLQEVQWGMMLSGVLIAVSTVVGVTWNHPARLAMIIAASTRCRELELEAAHLWQRLSWYDDARALNEADTLSKGIDVATEPVQLAGIGFSHRRNERAAAHVRAQMEWAVPTQSVSSNGRHE